MRSKIFTRTVGYWPLQESSGQAQDYSGNENHATTTQVTSYDVSGPLGGTSMDFDGSSDYIDTTIDSSFNQMSFFAWVKKSSWSTQYENVVSDFDSGLTSFIYFQRDGSNNHFRTEMRDGNGNKVSAYGSKDIADSKWHLVGFTFDGTKLNQYVDSVKDGSGSNNSIGPVGNSNPLHIATTTSLKQYWKGKIAHVRIWDYPLTAGQIRALYNASRGGFAETSRKGS